MTLVLPKPTKQQVKNELWRRGELEFLCHVVQKEMREIFYKSQNHSILAWLLSRQSGKSTLMCILALEAGLRKPNSVIKLITDTKVHAKMIFGPIFNELLATCPEELKPKFQVADYCYTFVNGSQIQLAGSDGQHYERLRGQRSNLVLIDEAGFCDDLDIMVNSVLLPTTTHTGGKLVLATTPPKEFTHPFLTFMERAEVEGLLTKKTVYDNPLLSEEQVAVIEKQMGGKNSEQFRREYLCDIIKLSSDSALPEVTDELLAEIVKEWPAPPFYDVYMSMDLGYTDLTAVLFAYYDFAKDKIVIQDEISFDFKKKGNDIGVLCKQIKEKEEEVWENLLVHEVRKPLARISDINHIVTAEMYKHSGGELKFSVPDKDDKAASINNLRLLLANHKIIISPKCKTLIRHLKNVKWNKAGKEFTRSVDDSHYDFVDAILYLARGIHFKKNPYPHGYGLNLRSDDLFVSNPGSFYGKKSHNDNAYRQILGMKKK